MKKVLFGLLMIVTVFLMAACSSDGEETESNASNSSSSEDQSVAATSTNQGEKVVLKSTVQSPQGAAMSESFDALLDLVEEKSNGQIEFERYYGDALVKPVDVTDALGAGIADVAFVIPDNTAKSNPLATINTLPGIWSSSYVSSKTLNTLYEEFPEMKEEFTSRNIVPLSTLGNSPYYFFSTKDVSSLEDIKGQKTIAVGTLSVVADALGATPVAIQTPESYESLERGTVEGTISGYGAAEAYGLEEITKSVFEVPLGAPGPLIAMNKSKLESLPENLQQVLLSLNEEAPKIFHEKYQAEYETASIKIFEDAGVKINKVDDATKQEILKIMEEKVWSNYVNSTGDTGQAILKRAVELAAQFEEEYQTLYGQ